MKPKTKENLDKEMRGWSRGSRKAWDQEGEALRPSLFKPQALIAGRGNDNVFKHKRHGVRGKNS